MPKTKVDYERIARYVESNPIECYVHYDDELSDDFVELLLQGKKDEVRWKIEELYYDGDYNLDYYWQELCDELDITKEELEDWRDTDGFYPSFNLTDDGLSKLMANTTSYITATMWDCDFNFYNWAYGGPITYDDVKETLSVLGINPYEFKKKAVGGSLTSGEGKVKGYFPNLPSRVPAVDVDELWGNLIVLYNGVLNFCLGDLENVAEVLSQEGKYITFKAGTNVVMYDFGNGAGITDCKLIRDVRVPRSKVEFRNDKPNTYGIQSCYGFVNSFWKEGGISNEGNSK